MGSHNAQGMVTAVEESGIGIHEALSWHLQSNHYPPVNTVFIPTCLEAIEAYNAGRIGDIIDMPNDKRLTAAAIVMQLHLEPFLKCEEE